MCNVFGTFTLTRNVNTHKIISQCLKVLSNILEPENSQRLLAHIYLLCLWRTSERIERLDMTIPDTYAESHIGSTATNPRARSPKDSAEQDRQQQQQQQQQPFNGRLSGTTRVGRYHKKHLPTHTHPGQRTSFITFLHLQRSMASSLFSLRA